MHLCVIMPACYIDFYKNIALKATLKNPYKGGYLRKNLSD